MIIFTHAKSKYVYAGIYIHVQIYMRDVHMRAYGTVLLRDRNNWGLQNSFQRVLVPVYYWKTVEKSETYSQLLW